MLFEFEYTLNDEGSCYRERDIASLCSLTKYETKNEILDDVLLLDMLMDVKSVALKKGWIRVDESFKHLGMQASYMITEEGRSQNWIMIAKALYPRLIAHADCSVQEGYLKEIVYEGFGRKNHRFRVTGKAVMQLGDMVCEGFERTVTFEKNAHESYDDDVLAKFASGSLL